MGIYRLAFVVIKRLRSFQCSKCRIEELKTSFSPLEADSAEQREAAVALTQHDEIGTSAHEWKKHLVLFLYEHLAGRQVDFLECCNRFSDPYIKRCQISIFVIKKENIVSG